MYRYWAGKDWPEWRTKDFVSLSWNTLVRIIFWPLIAIWMCLERSSKLGRMMATPASCFLNNVASYLYFVAFVLIMNVWSPDGPNHRGLPRTAGNGFKLIFLVLKIQSHRLLPWFDRRGICCARLGCWILAFNFQAYSHQIPLLCLHSLGVVWHVHERLLCLGLPLLEVDSKCCKSTKFINFNFIANSNS